MGERLSEVVFKEYCQTIVAHDARIASIDRWLRDEDAENGEGLFTALPATSVALRRATIRLLSLAAGLGPESSTVEYYFDECLSMRSGGLMRFSDGAKFAMITIDDLWRVVEYERTLPTPTPPRNEQ